MVINILFFISSGFIKVLTLIDKDAWKCQPRIENNQKKSSCEVNQDGSVCEA